MGTRRDNIAIGAELENHVAAELRRTGLDPRARRNPDSGSGNREKADIDTNLEIQGLHAHIECKNWTRHGMAAWIQHAEYGAGMGHALPVLIYKLRRDGMHKARAIIPLETFIELLVKAGGITVQRTVEVDSKQARYFAGKLKNAAAKIAKLADEEHPNARLLQYARQEIRAAEKGLLEALENDYGN